MSGTPQKFMIWQPPTHGEEHWAILLKIIFNENCMKYTALHEAQFPDSPHHHKRLEAGVQCTK